MEDLPGISLTALWVANMRSTEARRADPLFDDPLAGAFTTAAADDRLGVANTAARMPGASDYVALRARYFDDVALAGCADGIRQVVLLAAGLDTRAFRVAWPPGVRLFEVDLPATFAFKEPVLADRGVPPRCERVTVAADLRTDWLDRLTDAGFATDQPAVWLAEGLVQYLTDDEIDTLLGALCPGRVGFDYLTDAATDRPRVRLAADAIRSMDADLRYAREPEQFLTSRGWDVAAHRIAELAQRYGRVLPPDSDFVSLGSAVFVSGTR